MVSYLHNERFLAVHRPEDVALIADVIKAHQPAHIIELGTHYGGLAAVLAETAAAWGGTVHTFDVTVMFDGSLLSEYQNLRFYQENVLALNPRIVELVVQPGAILYTDNGHKEQEIALYAPRLASGNLLGTHDYKSEVRPEFVEPFLASLNYETHRQEEFSALNSPYYPIGMARFWKRR